MDSVGGTAPAFDFNFAAPLTRVSDDAIIDALRRFAKGRPERALGISDFDRWPGRPCSSQTVSHRFGSWRAALRQIGHDSAASGPYTPAELVEKLEHAWRTLGRRPGHTTLPRAARVTPFPFRRHWGSLENACRALEAFHRGHITRDQLLSGTPVGQASRLPNAPRATSGSPASAPRRRPLRPGLRYAVMSRDQFRCTLCGRGAQSTPPVELEIDHIVPVSKGGSDDETNLRVLCHACNRGKGARTPAPLHQSPERKRRGSSRRPRDGKP